MKGTSRPARVFQRGDIWWFRAKVPKDLRGILGRREYRYSLKTKSLGIAASKANELSRQVDEEIAAARLRASATPECGREPTITHSLTEEQILTALRAAPLDLIRLNWQSARLTGQWSPQHHQALDRLLKRQGHIVPTNSRLFAELRNRLALYFDETEFPLWSGEADESEQTNLADAISKFEQSQAREYSRKTRDGMHNVLRLLGDVLGPAHPLALIGPKELRAVYDCLRALPPNRHRRAEAAELSLALVASAAERLGRPRLSPRSVQTYSGYLQTFFGFVDQEMQAETALLPIWKSLVGQRPAQSRYRKRAFRPDELKRLFAAPVFTGCEDDRRGFSKAGKYHPRRARFWIPLLALYGGVPLEEACGLTVDQVHRGTSGYRLAIANKQYWLPEAFCALGFDRCLEQAAVHPDGRMFPELQKGQGGYHSDPFSQWFRRLLKSQGFNSRALSFRSLLLTYRQRQIALTESRAEFRAEDDPVLQVLMR